MAHSFSLDALLRGAYAQSHMARMVYARKHVSWAPVRLLFVFLSLWGMANEALLQSSSTYRRTGFLAAGAGPLVLSEMFSQW